MLNQARRIPFSPYRMIQAHEFEQVIERMRINVPSSIRESERTLAERDRILAEAHAEAERMVQQARQQVMEMVNERALVVTARNEAERIVMEGKETAKRRADEADRYAVQVLEDLAGKLQTFLKQVDNGIQMMRKEELPTGDVAATQKPESGPGS